jgi:V/A-type H+-transporting ATPase subunit I
MIVSMKKVAILVQSKDSADTVQKLRSLGVVHVEHQRPPKDKDVGSLLDDTALIEGALVILSQEEFTGKPSLMASAEPLDWRVTAKHILNLRNRLNQLKDYSLTLRGRISQLERWGDFNPEDILKLREKGIYIKLYRIPVKEIKDLPSELIVKRVYSAGGIANCITISQEEIDISFKEIELPKMGLGTLKQRLTEDSKMIALLREDILKAAAYRQAFLRTKGSLQEELEFHQTLKGMGQSGEVVYLTGYVPFDATEKLQQKARQEKWGIVITEPTEKDNVPTLIRNPRWVSIINPVFKLIEVVPGYKELDISLWFLIFFSIFFGMLVGDAGLGLVFLVLTYLAQRKWGPRLKDRSLFILLYISSFCTVVWGALTGTFFGQEWLPQSIKPLMPALRSDKNIQTLCFLLGALHLSIAHSWRAIIKLPSLAALAEAGWICILWGAFFLARMLVLGENFPVAGKWFFISGAVLVLFFTNPSKNVFRGIGSGLASLLLNLINSFTDVVSYVRLFAVGLATVAIADAFNGMALEIGFNNILTTLVTALVLLVGLSLNVILAPLSILVHGVRLNVLEFCNHADVKWSGFAYSPLRKKALTKS